MRISSAVAEFILHAEAEGLSASTLTWYRSILGRFADQISIDLRDVTAHEIREYLVRLRRSEYSESTVSAHTRALHRFWSWAATEYRIENPMRTISYPKMIQPTPRAVDLNDLKRMIEATSEDAVGARDRAMIFFMMDTGARAGGVVGLTVEDVLLDERLALVTEKGNKTRGVVYSTITAAVLATWQDHRLPDVKPYFYSSRTLDHMTSSGLYQVMKRLARRAGVQERFNPHALRHAFAREYIRNGGDLATLSKLLGHRDVSTTVNHYIIFSQAELKSAHDRFSPARRLSDQSE